MRPTLLIVTICLLAGPTLVRGEAFDERLAMRTLKQSKCLNCHSVTREKDGPSYQKVAEKYKDHPDARQALFTHLTTSPAIMVKGREEAHTSFKTDNTAEVMNVVDWILSQ